MNVQAIAPTGYIQSQIDRLKAELALAVDQFEASTKQVATGNEHIATECVAGIRRQVDKACDEAAAECLGNARRHAWRSALTLSAPWGPGSAQFLCWLGLCLGFALLVLRGGMTPQFALLFAVAGYVGLVAWGRGREALRTSREEREAIEAFRTLDPILIAFGPDPTDDPDYPYRGTTAPVGKGEFHVSGFTLGKKTGKESQLGATFLGFRQPGGKTCILSRYPLDPFGHMAMGFNDLKEDDPRWTHWRPLAVRVAACTTEQASAIRQFENDVVKQDAAAARMRFISQRIETLAEQDMAWADVALPPEKLDSILRLVDAFKSGRPVKGILLYGPPGTGKTLIARKLSRHSDCHFVAVGISDLKGQHIGHTGPRVRDTWEKCRANAPAILFVDECESVFASRGSSNSDAFNDELVQTFLAEWDGFNQSSGQVFVIGATNRHDLIDNAIMSRFTESIEIAVPDAEGRFRILGNEFSKAHLDFVPTEEMARETAGMTGRDIATLVSKIVASHIGSTMTQEVFAAEVRKLRGKQSTSVERLGWGDLVLPESTMADFKSLGRELVHAEDLRKLGVGVPRGILLYGPPGTGKTQIARVLASESGLAFIAASSSDLKAGYTGQSGGRVKQLFEKARGQAPCILFLDEIDAIAQARGQGDSFSTEIVAQLLQELDGVGSRKGQVFLLAASNHPQGIDPALLSRFERKIEIGLPDEPARAAILGLQLGAKPVGFDVDEACARLAAATAGLSGRDLQSLVTTATRRALQRAMEGNGDPRSLVLVYEDLESALGRSASTGGK